MLFSLDNLRARGVLVGEFPAGEFRYGEIESAIAAIHNISASGHPTYKSRLKHFQRIGLVSSSPGRGIKKTYNVIDAVAWALCFEFAELAIPPETIKTIMSSYIDDLFNFFITDTHNSRYVFVMAGAFFSWHINLVKDEQFDDEINLNISPQCRILSLSNSKDLETIISSQPRWIVVDLTHVKDGLARELGISWPVD